MNMQEKRELLEKACLDSLEKKGMIRYRQAMVDLPLNKEFHFWVGLNSGVDRGMIFIEPFVGVHAVKIEKMWTKLRAGSFNIRYSRSLATSSRFLGDLIPNEIAFRYKNEFDTELESNRLASTVYSVAKSFAEEIADYTSLASLLSNKVNNLGGYPERYACCLFIMGKENESLNFVDQFEKLHPHYMSDFSLKFAELIKEN